MSPIACPHEDSPTTVWMCPSCFDKLEKLEAINRELVEALDMIKKHEEAKGRMRRDQEVWSVASETLRRAREGGK